MIDPLSPVRVEVDGLTGVIVTINTYSTELDDEALVIFDGSKKSTWVRLEDCKMLGE